MTLAEAIRKVAELYGVLFNGWNTEGMPVELRAEMIAPSIEALDVLLQALSEPARPVEKPHDP